MMFSDRFMCIIKQRKLSDRVLLTSKTLKYQEKGSPALGDTFIVLLHFIIYLFIIMHFCSLGEA